MLGTSVLTSIILLCCVQCVLCRCTKEECCQLKPSSYSVEAIQAEQAAIALCNMRTGPPIESCDPAYKYRTFDGSCNNLFNPDWGKANTCHQRLLPHDYNRTEFGISYPRTDTCGNELPNVRLISNALHKEKVAVFDPKNQTDVSLELGQVLGHDSSHNSEYASSSKANVPGAIAASQPCCLNGPTLNSNCSSVPLPAGEEFYTKCNINCIPFGRTKPCSCNETEHWQSLNTGTAFLDLGIVYGNSESIADSLRSWTGGLMTVTTSDDGDLLPRIYSAGICVSPSEDDPKCFKNGDDRGNQTPLLLVFQTLFVRFHNYICVQLAAINTSWDDETLYQEARRINIAAYQSITYGSYLKSVIGDALVNRNNLAVLSDGYSDYDPTLNPTIFDEFAAAAARYGHTKIRDDLSQVDSEGKVTEVLLADNYGPLDFKFSATCKGMTIDPDMKFDVLFVDGVRNHLHQRVYLNETCGLDLPATSDVRGRDHGIPGYSRYIEYCLNTPVRSFKDLKQWIPKKLVNKLRQLYKCVHDVDLYSGALAEIPVEGGIVGPVFACILSEQYRRLKFGDRFYFEHGGQPGSFTLEQVKALREITMSTVICCVSGLSEIQENVFYPPSAYNPLTRCEDQCKRFSFDLWRELIEPTVPM